MSADPRERDAQERNALADLIAARAVEIERRWLQTILADLKGKDVSPTELRDGMPDYLRRVAEVLRTSDGVANLGEAAWADVAREHAITRVRLGFDVDELLHEFVVLRRVLFDVLQSEKTVANLSQARRLAELIDAAVSVSVRSYIAWRDYDARRKEAQHVAFITHELRNPLTTAMIAATHLGRAAPADATRHLEILERSLRRLRDLIDGVLAIERLEAGKIEAHAIDLRLADILDEPLEAAEMAAHAKGLELVANIPDAMVHADRELTASALSNVLENAVKFTDTGVVSVEAEESDDTVVVHVRDNCDGISPEELATIFEPFERGHTKKRGTGLGLAIARRALEASGCALHAESTSERGCHFWMTLPKARH